MFIVKQSTKKTKINFLLFKGIEKLLEVLGLSLEFLNKLNVLSQRRVFNQRHKFLLSFGDLLSYAFNL